MAVLFVIWVMTMLTKLSSAAVLGGDLDSNGCDVSTGYSWCESLSECIRSWETDCDDDDTDLVVGGDLDSNGCYASAGYSWCDSLSQCIRSWETDCSDDDTDLVLGGDLDSNGCDVSTGYSWCESLSQCIRSWETECSDPTPEPTPQPIARRRRGSRSGDAQPMAFGDWLWNGMQFLKIPDRVPTLFVFFVAILVVAAVAAVRCCGWKRAQTEYKAVMFGDAMASDVETEVEEAIGA